MGNNILEKVEILYEDDSCVVVNKPAGLMVHPDGRDEGPFLTDWVVQRYPEAVDVGEPARTPHGEPIPRPGIVHRLDRETSGALVITKTDDAHAALKRQFQERSVTKKYLAYVWGQVKEEFGTITRPIGRSSSDFRKWSAQRGARGEMRDAETYWTKVRDLMAPVAGEGGMQKEKFTLVEVEPKTGRTHQIRVHFLAIHHPVVSDMLYAPNKPKALGFDRTALHAKSVEFTSPATGKRVKVEAPLPEDFKRAEGLSV